MNEEESLKKKFGCRVKYLRKINRITQEQLSGMIHIEPPNISKMEKGIHFPSPKNIEKLAEILQVEVKDLFDFENLNENLNKLNSIRKNRKLDKYDKGKTKADIIDSIVESKKDEIISRISDFLNSTSTTYNDIEFIYNLIQSLKSYKKQIFEK